MLTVKNAMQSMPGSTGISITRRAEIQLQRRKERVDWEGPYGASLGDCMIPGPAVQTKQLEEGGLQMYDLSALEKEL